MIVFGVDPEFSANQLIGKYKFNVKFTDKSTITEILQNTTDDINEFQNTTNDTVNILLGV